jgi:hypothetical protein
MLKQLSVMGHRQHTRGQEAMKIQIEDTILMTTHPPVLARSPGEVHQWTAFGCHANVCDLIIIHHHTVHIFATCITFFSTPIYDVHTSFM